MVPFQFHHPIKRVGRELEEWLALFLILAGAVFLLLNPGFLIQAFYDYLKGEK